MPGRYVQGASDSCIFTTTSRWIPQWTQTYQCDWAVIHPYDYASAVVWTPFAQNPFSNGGVSVGYQGGGISAVLNVLPGVRQNILVPVQSNYGGPFRITATQGVGVDSIELAYQIVQGEGTYMLDFTPTGGNVRLNIIRPMNYNDGITASVTLLAPRRYDLDGLEEYHARDGSVITSYGNSTEIRIVFDDMIQRTRMLAGQARSAETDAINNEIYNDGSAPVFRSLDATATGWANRFNGLSISRDREYGSNTFTVKIGDSHVASYTRPKIGPVATADADKSVDPTL